MSAIPRVQIEFPSRGATYCRNEYGVYEYDRYPRNSVLAFQQRRRFVTSFKTKAEAVAKYPNAQVLVEGGTGYQKPDLSHLPDGPDL